MSQASLVPRFVLTEMLSSSQSHSLQVLPELIDGLPNISGWEEIVRAYA